MDYQINTEEYKYRIEHFINELVKENKTPHALQEDRNYVSEFLSYVEEQGITKFQSINQSIFDKYFIYLTNERTHLRRVGHLAEGTINKHKNSLRRFWKYLNAEEIYVHSVVVRQRKKRITKEIVVLTPQEIEQLYSVTDDTIFGYRDRAMLALFYGCGLRKSEGANLLIPDIDFARGRIHIRQAKNNRERYVMLSPKVQAHLEQYVYSSRELYLPENSTCENLIIGEHGGQLSGQGIFVRIKSLWSKVKDKYGTEKHIGVHTLRHSLGTQLYIAGMGIDQIALMLGHRSLEATQLYIHLANKLKL